MKTVKIVTSRVAQVSNDDDAVNNEDGENATNKGRQINDTEYPQGSEVPDTDDERIWGEENRTER